VAIDPSDRSSQRGLLLGILAATAIAAGWLLVAEPVGERVRAAFGADGGSADASVNSSSLRPDPSRATEDRGRLYADGCFAPRSEARVRECAYGDRSGTRTVVLVGDSHAMHYFPALDAIAANRGWRLVGLLKAGCPLTTRGHDPPLKCDVWRGRVLNRITRRIRPDLVIAGSSDNYVARGRRSMDASQTPMAQGYLRTLKRIRRTGAELFVLRDTPWAPRDTRACVVARPNRPASCGFRRGRGPGPRKPYGPRAAAKVRSTLLDPARRVCPRGRCPSVDGDVLVWRDDSHLTATYARTLAPWFARRLPRQLDRARQR
jgi:hypothetical protein